MNRKNLISGCAAVVLGLAAPIASHALNPQPEPPASEIKKKLESPLARKSINPQPEPPGAAPGNNAGVNAIGPKPEDPLKKGAPTRGADKGGKSSPGITSPGTLKGFNPQPEPPGKPAAKSAATPK
jgi:hypothetical protein